MYIPTITVEIKGANTRNAIALNDTDYLNEAINPAIKEYLDKIDASARLKKLMTSLYKYTVRYSCELDNGEVIALPSSISYMSAHDQITAYCKDSKNIDIQIESSQPIWQEIMDKDKGIFEISLQFKARTLASQ